MKGFLKFIGSIIAIFAAVIGALAVFDNYVNKNRIKGDYLDCDTSEFDEESNETEE